MSASRPNESAWNMVQRYGLYWESPNKGKKKTMRFSFIKPIIKSKNRTFCLHHPGDAINSHG